MTDVVWNNDVSVEDLSDEQVRLYVAYKASYKAMIASKASFEASMQTLACPGKAMVFNYRFGKLSLAQVDASEKKAIAVKTSKPKQSLSEWLASQNGHNV